MEQSQTKTISGGLTTFLQTYRPPPSSVPPGPFWEMVLRSLDKAPSKRALIFDRETGEWTEATPELWGRLLK